MKMMISRNWRGDSAIILRFLIVLGSCVLCGWTIHLEPDKETVVILANHSYAVSCQANNAFRLMWTKPTGEQITEERNRVHVEERKEGQGLDLIFQRIGKRDKGLYTCSANEEGNEVSVAFNLSVIIPLSFVDTESVQSTPEGSDFVIRCEIQGEPEPKLLNIRKDSNKSGAKRMRAGIQSKLALVADGLSIRNVTRDDAGIYICRAMQETRIKTFLESKNIVLKVQHPPDWIDFPDATPTPLEYYGFIGGSVNLSCTANAEPAAEINWLRDNENLSISDTYRVIDGDNNSILEVTLEDEFSFGEYSCRATNALGHKERSLVIQKAPKPPKPQIKLSGATPSSLLLGLSNPSASPHIPNSLPLVGFRVEVKKVREEWNQARTIDLNSDSAYVIESLLPGTAYNLRAASRNAAGLGDFSVPIEARTKEIQANPMSNAAPAVIPNMANMITLINVSILLSRIW